MNKNLSLSRTFTSTLLRASCVLLVTLVSSCGGGGGGGGGTGIRLIHGVIDAPALSLNLAGKDAVLLATSRFALEAPFASISDGDQIVVGNVLGGPKTEIFSQSIAVKDGMKYTVLFYGSQSTLGLRTAVFEDDPPTPGTGEVAVRVVNALAGAAAIDAKLGSTSIGGATPFGKASDYVTLPVGAADLLVRRSADKDVVFSGSQTFLGGGAYTIVVTGEVNYLVLAPVYTDQ